MDDTFDPERLGLPPELAAKLVAARAKPKQAQKRKRAEPFLQIPHKSLVAGAEVLRGTKQFLVWLYVHHRIWADKVNTVVIGNKTLGAWGVSRAEKCKALRRLEAARLISVQWRVRLSPLVTLASRG